MKKYLNNKTFLLIFILVLFIIIFIFSFPIIQKSNEKTNLKTPDTLQGSKIDLTNYFANQKLPPMKIQDSYVFFGDDQMKAVLDYDKKHKEYTFFSFARLGTIKFMYCSQTNNGRSIIDIELYHSEYGSEIELSLVLNPFRAQNYNPDHSFKCLKDMCKFLNINPLVTKRLKIVFNKYIIRDKILKNHVGEILIEAMRRGNILAGFKKNKYSDEIGFYFQLTKKWRLYVYGKLNIKDINTIFYRLNNNSGDEKFLIDLTKQHSKGF